MINVLQVLFQETWCEANSLIFFFDAIKRFHFFLNYTQTAGAKYAGVTLLSIECIRPYL